MMRIAHFSDIHVGCWPQEIRACFDKRLLGSLNYRLRRQRRFSRDFLPRALRQLKMLAPDWVVCTGDLTSVGTREEFAAALTGLAPILSQGSPPLIYVPGNHDAYVRRPSCRAALEDTFDRLNDGRWSLADLPQDRWVQEVRLFIVNECRPTNCFLSSGTIGSRASERLRGWLAEPRQSGERRVLIGHFPCRGGDGRPLGWRRGLRGWRVVDEALRDGLLDVALCGHEHRPFLRHESSGAMEICAGSLTTHGRFSVLDYVPETGRFSHFWVDVSGEDATPLPAADNSAPVAALE